eukprot:TRINITY_DN4080_c0_g1_i1.p1 TRINITY_DN4080_c0_g1~~TRINITY_DN4080_c0_g1_i1.p1  ORF type:complete len:306 (-),score=87.65 TRINITY_DN4080_c0_g1_i1:572-1489(-)
MMQQSDALVLVGGNEDDAARAAAIASCAGLARVERVPLGTSPLAADPRVRGARAVVVVVPEAEAVKLPSALILLGALGATRPESAAAVCADAAVRAECAALGLRCAATWADCTLPAAAPAAGAASAVGADVTAGAYHSMNVRPRAGCTAAALHALLLRLLRDTTRGAVYLWTPVYGGAAQYGPVAEALGFATYLATGKYLIYYRWCNPHSPDRVPPPATSEVGACAMLVTAGLGSVLLGLEKRPVRQGRSPQAPVPNEPGFQLLWRLPGGAVDFGETDLDGLLRELREELCASLKGSFGSIGGSG